MANGKKSFGSSMAGLITGLAGVATAIVALLGLAVNQGWVGGSSGTSKTTTTLAPGRPGSSTGGGATSGGSSSGGASNASATPSFTATPSSLTLSLLGTKQSPVTVTNTGSEKLSITDVEVIGTNASDFAARGDDCTGADVSPHDSCTVNVTLSSSSGTSSATLVITAGEVTKRVELQGRAI